MHAVNDNPTRKQIRRTVHCGNSLHRPLSCVLYSFQEFRIKRSMIPTKGNRIIAPTSLDS